jgi:hypothetical protein
MNLKNKVETDSEVSEFCGAKDSEGGVDKMEETLRDFRMSLHAWSAAAYQRPRTVAATAHRWRIGRLAVSWGLGCVLVIGGVAGGVYTTHHQQPQLATNKSETVRVAEPAPEAAVQTSRQVQKHEDEDLLAQVDSDVARQVPSAMEPLAQLMGKDEVQ